VSPIIGDFAAARLAKRTSTFFLYVASNLLVVVLISLLFLRKLALFGREFVHPDTIAVVAAVEDKPRKLSAKEMSSLARSMSFMVSPNLRRSFDANK
jgi:hypothetical protein